MRLLLSDSVLKKGGEKNMNGRKDFGSSSILLGEESVFQSLISRPGRKIKGGDSENSPLGNSLGSVKEDRFRKFEVLAKIHHHLESKIFLLLFYFILFFS